MIVEVNGCVFDTDEVKIITTDKVTKINRGITDLQCLTYDRGGIESDGKVTTIKLHDDSFRAW